MPVLDPATCEDVPDPADHPLGELPIVLRPCTLPTELVVNVVHTGTGRAAENGDTLIVDYTGIRSADGELFDTSYLRGVPFDFVIGRGGVIVGWDVGLLGGHGRIRGEARRAGRHGVRQHPAERRHPAR